MQNHGGNVIVKLQSVAIVKIMVAHHGSANLKFIMNCP